MVLSGQRLLLQNPTIALYFTETATSLLVIIFYRGDQLRDLDNTRLSPVPSSFFSDPFRIFI